MAGEVIQTVISVGGNTIRVTAAQWAHLTEAHDYMSGNLDIVLETLAEPGRILTGDQGESLALRDYAHTIISRKTAVVIYRDEPDGFVITAFLTSRPDKIEGKYGQRWPKLASPDN